MGNGEGPTLITSVQRAFRLMEAVGAHEGGAPAKQLARETGLPLATAYHLLRTLVHDGYIRKLDDGGFVLGRQAGTRCRPAGGDRRCSAGSAPRSPRCGTSCRPPPT